MTTLTIVRRAFAAAFLTAALGAVLAPPADAATILSVRVKPFERGIEVPKSFLGFAVSYPLAAELTGLPEQGINPVFKRMLSDLNAGGGGPVALRIGGQSADRTWWNPSGAQRPAGVTQDVDPAWLSWLGEFQRQTRTPLIMGLNEAVGDPAVAADLARAISERVDKSALLAYEVGYHADGYPGAGRPAGWGPAEHRSELRRYADAITAAVPGARIAGSALSPKWVKPLGDLGRVRDKLALATATYAPLSACPQAGSHAKPTVARLLSKSVARRLLTYAPALERLERAGMGLRITKAASADCGGRAGVTDTLASAIWATDTLFGLALLGYSGIDLEVGLGAASPFRFLYDSAAKRWVGVVRPMFYGARIFAEATRGGARLLSSATYASRRRRGARASIWATRDRGGRLRFVVAPRNRSARGGTVRVRVPNAYRAGRLTVLDAPRLSSTTGVRFGGRSYPARTTDGRLTGSARSRKVRAKRGVYAFKVPREGIFVLEVPRPPRKPRKA